jgi:hypothetical protein
LKKYRTLNFFMTSIKWLTEGIIYLLLIWQERCDLW